MENSQSTSEDTQSTIFLRNSCFQTPAKVKPAIVPQHRQIEDTATFPSRLYLQAKGKLGDLRIRDLNLQHNAEKK